MDETDSRYYEDRANYDCTGGRQAMQFDTASQNKIDNTQRKGIDGITITRIVHRISDTFILLKGMVKVFFFINRLLQCLF